MPQKDLERAQVHIALQLHGRVGRPKFMQEPVLAVRSQPALSFTRLARPAIESCRPGDTLERAQEVPIRLARRSREEEPRSRAELLAMLPQTFHQHVG